jgi:hypothetical protein
MTGDSAPLSADVRPTKRFFIGNLVRDLTLEDAILDLIDNAVDSFVRTRDCDVSSAMLSRKAPNGVETFINLTVTSDEFRIDDKCGGMDIDRARTSVFRLGRTDASYVGALGVYGIGLKRALFKLGDEVVVQSRTMTSGFRVAFGVSSWAADEDNWTLPLEAIPAAASQAESGTSISVRNLTPEVRMRIADGSFLTGLAAMVSTTYALFMGNFLGISLNSQQLSPKPLPLAGTEFLAPNAKALALESVSVNLVCGLQQRRNDEWITDSAGWYVLCNGRVVVSADRTELTGWGTLGPSFVSKFRGFLGIAFFFSSNPADLPWTTTKRGINRESPSFQAARNEMALLARPVLSFLNSFYPADPAERGAGLKLVEALEPADIGQIVTGTNVDFPKAVPGARRRGQTVRVQFDAARVEVDRVRKAIGKPNLSAGAIGRHAFDHFLRTECPE